MYTSYLKLSEARRRRKSYKIRQRRKSFKIYNCFNVHVDVTVFGMKTLKAFPLDTSRSVNPQQNNAQK